MGFRLPGLPQKKLPGTGGAGFSFVPVGGQEPVGGTNPAPVPAVSTPFQPIGGNTPGLSEVERSKKISPEAAAAAAPTPAAPVTGDDLIKALLDEERFKIRRDLEVQALEAKRNRDLQTGRDFIKDFSLGRMAQDEGRAAENLQLKQLLEGRLGGLSAGEGAAMREQALGGIGQQRQTDVRALRGMQGAQGVRGPAAVSQQQDIFNQAADRRSDLEQQLLLRNVAMKQQAAQDFGRELARQQTQGLGIEQFNIGQANQEQSIRQAFPFLFANLGAQEQAAATGSVVGRDALIASIFPEFNVAGDGSSDGGAGGGIGNIIPPTIPVAAAEIHDPASDFVRSRF